MHKAIQKQHLLVFEGMLFEKIVRPSKNFKNYRLVTKIKQISEMKAL